MHNFSGKPIGNSCGVTQSTESSRNFRDSRLSKASQTAASTFLHSDGNVKEHHSTMTALHERHHRPNNSAAAHQAVPYKTSEFIGIVHYLTAWLMQRHVPLPSIPGNFATYLGLMLCCLGACWIHWVHVELNRYKQPHQPGIPTTVLVTTGPFATMRHPTYASILLCIVPGLAMSIANPWVIILNPVAFVAFEYILIQEEEKYLQSLFGKKWIDYCKRTPRWIY